MGWKLLGRGVRPDIRPDVRGISRSENFMFRLLFPCWQTWPLKQAFRVFLTYGLPNLCFATRRLSHENSKNQENDEDNWDHHEQGGWVLDEWTSRKPRKYREPQEFGVQSTGSPKNWFRGRLSTTDFWNKHWNRMYLFYLQLGSFGLSPVAFFAYGGGTISKRDQVQFPDRGKL